MGYMRLEISANASGHIIVEYPQEWGIMRGEKTTPRMNWGQTFANALRMLPHAHVEIQSVKVSEK